MQDRFKAHIAGAQDPHKGEFFRIGHLGFIGGFDIITALTALEMTLGEMGYTNFEQGGSLSAAQTIIKENWI
jgi:aspartate aminotransferase-like enzyme